MKKPVFGVLAIQGGVAEHLDALTRACKSLKVNSEIRKVRYLEDLEGLLGIIIPGGESTVLHKLTVREKMFEKMKEVPAIFGTCAGMIMLAKHIEHGLPDQQTLGLMGISVDRNAYGPQGESFEADVETKLGTIHSIFIRAPKLLSYEKGVVVLATYGQDPIAFEEKKEGRYFLACSFHPELTTTLFHEYFVRQAGEIRLR